jgi:transcriptional regulator with XRE-family HTH domain
VSTSGSPAVRRRRLAAELRRLRGGRTGTQVARALGWSPSKVSRYEQGRSTMLPEEVGKLLDLYAVTDPERGLLLSLARDASQRGWWEDYADAVPEEYLAFIDLEAEATSVAHWQVDIVPGLLQTEDYARQLLIGYQSAVPIPPGVIERRVKVRMIRQRALVRDPPLQLSVVIDESVLLRRIGGPEIMHPQLLHLAEAAELPNVELRVLRLNGDNSLMANSFVIFGFSPDPFRENVILHDVVSAEGVKSEVYVEGETDTYVHRLVFQGLVKASLPPPESQRLIRRTAEEVWGSIGNASANAH